MTRYLSVKARLALLAGVLKLLRQRRRVVQTLTIRPDGTIDVQLGPPLAVGAPETPEDEIERWLRENPEVSQSQKLAFYSVYQ